MKIWRVCRLLCVGIYVSARSKVFEGEGERLVSSRRKFLLGLFQEDWVVRRLSVVGEVSALCRGRCTRVVLYRRLNER